MKISKVVFRGWDIHFRYRMSSVIRIEYRGRSWPFLQPSPQVLPCSCCRGREEERGRLLLSRQVMWRRELTPPLPPGPSCRPSDTKMSHVMVLDGHIPGQQVG